MDLLGRHCRLPAFIKLAATITRYRTLIVNAVEHSLSNARSEATNTHLRLLTRRAYGYRSPDALIAIADLTRGGLVVEGLDTLQHSGIVYRDGPTGRRAALAVGPDVWEVISALRYTGGSDAERVTALAEQFDLHPRHIRTAWPRCWISGRPPTRSLTWACTGRRPSADLRTQCHGSDPAGRIQRTTCPDTSAIRS